jgi:Ca-activated chloride channel family protein
MLPYMQQAIVPKSSGRRRNAFVEFLLLYFAWFCITLALCSPVLTPPPTIETKEARHILLATDISLSMDTRDWRDTVMKRPISRWDAAKEMTNYFIKARSGDYFAHVVFGNEAYLQVPFTTDPEVINLMTENIKVGMAGQKTSIGNAIGVSLEHFKSDSIAQRIMILITDGLDTQDGISPIQMAELAKTDSVRIYTIAMGSPSDGFKNINHDELKKISSITNGKSYQASSLPQLKAILDEINVLEVMEYEVIKEHPKQLLFYYPLFVGLIILMLSTMFNLIRKIR